MPKRLIMIEVDDAYPPEAETRKCSTCSKWQPEAPKDSAAYTLQGGCTNFGHDHVFGRDFFCRAWEAKP